MEPSPTASRRAILRAGAGAASLGAARLLTGCATAGPAPSVPGATAAPAAAASPPVAARGGGLETLASEDRRNGGAAPFPIPWLDKNGSHNQMPAQGVELSHLFHFKGRFARANDFKGTGLAGDGERLAFGAKSTDFSFQQGEYFAGRQARQGAFGHL